MGQLPGYQKGDGFGAGPEAGFLGLCHGREAAKKQQ